MGAGGTAAGGPQTAWSYPAARPPAVYQQGYSQAGSAPWHRLVQPSVPTAAAIAPVSVSGANPVADRVANPAAAYPAAATALDVTLPQPGFPASAGSPAGTFGAYPASPDGGSYRDAAGTAAARGYPMNSAAYYGQPQALPAGTRLQSAEDSELYAPVPEKPPSGMPEFGSTSGVELSR